MIRSAGGSTAQRDPHRRVDRSRRADRFGLRDAIAEATAGAGARPGRLVLTVLGTVLGIAALVVTVGLAQTGANRINERFDAVAARHALAQPATQDNGQGGRQTLGALPWDAAERAGRLVGVQAAATISTVDLSDATITAVPVNDPSAPIPTSPVVIATSPDLVDAAGGTISHGRFFDTGHDSRADRVVVLGEQAAQRLGVTRIATLPSVFIDDDAYQVIGILAGTERHAGLVSAVIIPEGTARADFDLRAPESLEMRIDVGAGPLITEQLPVALLPATPEVVSVAAPSRPAAVQQGIQADVYMVFLALAGVALLVGGVGIANVTLLSVMERAGEIGLRRALGARRREVAAQFVIESIIVGSLGGLIGAALGVGVVTAVSFVRRWTPVLDLRMVAAAAATGAVVGLLAGLYPAARAANMEPVAALRAGL